MDEDLVLQLNQLQKDFERQVKPEVVEPFVDPMLSLTGLRGAWPMSSIDASGNAFDVSGNGRTLSYNGNPTYNYDGLAPYIELDGTGDYLSRADEAGLDILGTETYIASAVRGLTVGGWFWVDLAATSQALISKAINSTTQVSFYLLVTNVEALQFVVSSNGTLASISVVNSSNTFDSGRWHYCVGRFDPSTEVAVFLDGVKTTNTTAIIASIFNSTSQLDIGRVFGGTLLDGRASSLWLCASALSDAHITAIFEQQRVLYGV